MRRFFGKWSDKGDPLPLEMVRQRAFSSGNGQTLKVFIGNGQTNLGSYWKWSDKLEPFQEMVRQWIGGSGGSGGSGQNHRASQVALAQMVRVKALGQHNLD